MDSQEPTIEEKLVPFVEGALADVDRREVMLALPNSPELAQEVRDLRQVILALRSQVSRGLVYEGPLTTPPEQVVDFAANSDQWSRPALRKFQLHMLESPQLADEVAILQELERELEGPAEALSVPALPSSLRSAFLEEYAPTRVGFQWKKVAAGLLAGLNWKVASAAAAGLAVVVAGVGVGRMLHQRLQAGPAQVAVVSSATPAAAASETPAPTPTSEPAPAGQVALLKEKVLPEDLPGLSRRLWQKQVSHSYRDGQIFVAQQDYDRAWSALQLNAERVAVAKPLKTGAAPTPEPESGLPQGIIGLANQWGGRSKDKAESSAGGAATTAVSGSNAAAAPPLPPEEPSSGGGDLPSQAVAIELPAAPEDSRGDFRDEPEPPPPSEVRPRRSVASAAVDTPAAPASEEVGYARQMARQESVAPPVRAVQPERRRETYSEVAPVRKNAAPPAPADQAVARARASAGGLPAYQSAPASAAAAPASAVAAPAPARSAAAAASAVAAPAPARAATVAAQAGAAVSEAIPAPAPSPAMTAPRAAANSAATPNKVAPAAAKEAPPAPAPVALVAAPSPSSSPEVDGLLGKSTFVRPGSPTTSPSPKEVPSPPLVTLRTPAASPKPEKKSELIEVKADAPFEVAMLPVAKKLVEELVGDSKVQMERKEDGRLLLTIRPIRALSPIEVDKLRKVVREKLALEDEDTVVIRQP